MRRTVVLVAGVCTAVALAGVAGAATYASTGDEPVTQRPAADAADAADAGPPAAAEKKAPVRDQSAPRTETDGPAADTPGIPGKREPIGAITEVNRLLGYLEAEPRMTFHYPGATYVKPHFNRLLLLPGDYVTVSNPAGTEVHRVDGDGTLLGGDGALLGGDGVSRGGAKGRWAMSVSGDTAVVELHSTRTDLLGSLGSTLAKLGIGVDKVAHGFASGERPAERPAERRARQPESVCGGDDKEDAVCYRSTDPVAYERSKAVTRLLINGTELCTAWRVGENNRLLTNNHCIATSDDAYETEVWFNYQCAQCGGHGVFRSTKVWGDKVLSTDETLDYTLFTIEDFDLVKKFGHLEFDLRRAAEGEELYIPQHPGGDPTMIAMDSDEDANGTCAVDDPEYTGYAEASDISYLCDTEGGSSGSPVLSKRTDKVLALHHFGGCPNSGVRIDLIHNKIKSRL